MAEDGQSDEIELDFDTLDSATLWKLEGYLRSLNPVAAGNGNFNVQVHRFLQRSSCSSDVCRPEVCIGCLDRVILCFTRQVNCTRHVGPQQMLAYMRLK